MLEETNLYFIKMKPMKRYAVSANWVRLVLEAGSKDISNIKIEI